MESNITSCITSCILIIMLIIVVFQILQRYSRRVRGFLEEINKKLRNFVVKILRVYLFLLQSFTMPLFMESTVIKVQNEYTKKNLEDISQKFEEENIHVEKIRKMNRLAGLGIEDFIVTGEGNILLNYPSINGYPRNWREFLGNWLGIPKFIWMLILLIFIVVEIQVLNSDDFSNPSRLYLIYCIIFWSFFIYSLISLITIILKPIKRINSNKLYHRWIFLLLPLIIGVSKLSINYYLTDINPNVDPMGRSNLLLFVYISIAFLYVSGLFLYLNSPYENGFEFNEYLKVFSRFLFKYQNYQEKLKGVDRPICCITLARSIDDIVKSNADDTFNSNMCYVDYYFREFFECGDENRTNKEKDSKHHSNTLSYFRMYEEDLGEINTKLIDLWKNFVDKTNTKLLIPYIYQPSRARDKVSAYCLIACRDDSIISINLPESIINAMVKDGSLWNAKNITEVITPYVKYHSQTLEDMEREMINAVEPLIDPTRLEKHIENVKKHSTALIRFDGLLHTLEKADWISVIGRRKVKKMRKKWIDIDRKYHEHMEKSDVFLQAENLIKTTRLTKFVVLLTVLAVVLGVFSKTIQNELLPKVQEFIIRELSQSKSLDKILFLAKLLVLTFFMIVFVRFLVSRNESL